MYIYIYNTYVLARVVRFCITPIHTQATFCKWSTDNCHQVRNMKDWDQNVLCLPRMWCPGVPWSWWMCVALMIVKQQCNEQQKNRLE